MVHVTTDEAWGRSQNQIGGAPKQTASRKRWCRPPRIGMPVPADEGLGFHEGDGVHEAVEAAGQRTDEPAIESAQVRAFDLSANDDELLARDDVEQEAKEGGHPTRYDGTPGSHAVQDPGRPGPSRRLSPSGARPARRARGALQERWRHPNPGPRRDPSLSDAGMRRKSSSMRRQGRQVRACSRYPDCRQTASIESSATETRNGPVKVPG